MAEAAPAAQEAAVQPQRAYVMQMDQADDIVDVDDREAQEAQAAAEQESAAATTAATGTPPGPPEATEPPAAAEGAPAPSGEAGGAAQQPAAPTPQPVPYARFKEVNDRARELERRAAFLEGALSARAAPAGQPGGQPAPDPRQQIQSRRETAEATLLQASERADRGEIGQAELAKAQIAFNREMRAIDHAEADLTRPAPAATRTEPAQVTRSLADEQILEQHVAGLEAKHPYAAMPFDQEQTRILTDRALDLARARSIQIPRDARGDMRLRELAAELTDHYGPLWFGALSPQQSTPAPAPATPQLSPQAKARQAKLDLAANHPPDTRNLGAAGSDASSIPTEAQIMAMSDLELEALPPATLARIQGRA